MKFSLILAVPSPFAFIEDYELTSLKELVVKELGHSVSSKMYCDLLSEQIEEKTKQNISINTLRRCFEVMPSTSKPSIGTLNILANYCGFADFYDFKRSQFYLSQSLSGLSSQAINDLYDDLGESQKFYDILSWLLILAFRENNVDFLKNFFNLKMLKDRKDYPRDLLQKLVQLFGTELRAHPQIFDLLIEHYATQPAAHSLYFEWFVDIDLLNLRFFKGMNAYSKNRNDSESRLFSLCVLFMHHFLLNEQNECEELLGKINCIELTPEMHPFPIGRKFACNILFNSFYKRGVHQDLISEIFAVERWVHSTDNFVDRNLPSFHLMIVEAFSWSGLSKQAEMILDLAGSAYQSVIDKASSGSIIPLQMYRAKSLNHFGKRDDAIDIISRIDISNFDIPWKNFYWMNYNLVSSEIHRSNNPKLAAKLNLTAKEIANHHKFLFFKKMTR